MRWLVLCYLLSATLIRADLWTQTATISDLQQFRFLCSRYTVAEGYMKNENARLTVFAPTDGVFAFTPDYRALGQKEVLAHIADSQITEIGLGKRWNNQTLVRSTINSGYIYITQFENSPGNFSYFANAGYLCNHATNEWGMISGNQYLYKMCTPIGHRPYPGTALSFIREREEYIFSDRLYNNKDLTILRDLLDDIPDISLVIYGSSAWNGFHTFFLPNNQAFAKVTDRKRVDRDVLLAHVTGVNRVLFTWPWMYDGGTHYYPTVRFSSNLIEDNYKMKLVLRNITDRITGKYDLYAVAEVYERYAQFRRGGVWAKILVPNIPVQNGVVHVVDTVLGLVTKTIDEMLMENPKCTTLMRYINQLGDSLRTYLSATGGLVTFFAPWNYGFDRIPEQFERKLLRDRNWLIKILMLHIIPAKELTVDEITNETMANTVDNLRQLFFIRGEWPANNITYYVIGGGIKTAIMQENVAATNGIIHYIERFLGVPYQTLWEVLRNESRLQRTYEMMDRLQIKYTLDPKQVLIPEQNLTFFVPVNEAWREVPPTLVDRMNDGKHALALQYVFKRHILQGQALSYVDLQMASYVMMNDEKVVIRRRGRYFELFWPKGNRVARIIEGGEILGINGYMHMIDNVLIYEPDLRAPAAMIMGTEGIIAVLLALLILNPRILRITVILSIIRVHLR